MADLGSQLGPAEADDQVADLGEHRDQANGQWQQGGRKMRCREESEASSMIHRGALSGRVTGSVPSVTSQERRLSFNSPELIQGGTQATPRVKTARISWKSLALARSHPVDRPGDHDRRLDAVPRTDRRSLRCGAASGLPIPHPARGEQGDPLGRGPGTQASGSRRPKLPRGRPSSKAAKRAARRKKRIKQKVGELFAHRYLFVQRRLSPSERATLQRICRGWPQLRSCAG